LTIERNQLSDCGQCGIYVDGQMLVIDNTIVRANPGILVATSEQKIIKRNTLRDAHGINILDKNLAGVSGNIIQP
jgi:hypothetical protein